MPEELVYDPNSNPPCYQTLDQSLKIEKDEWIRLKIVGTRVDATDIV
jgi:DNA-directed RNA polymerase II subunit RPB7